MISRTIASWGRLLGLGRDSTTTEEERRAFGRIHCDVETTCQPANHSSGTSVTVKVRNVSRGGIGMSLDRSFVPGELVSIRLPGTPAEEASDVLACVVRCEDLTGGRWDLGCTFASPLNDEDLRRFGSRHEESVQPDQRGWMRFPCQARAAYQVIRSPEPSSMTPSEVVNVSGGGIALHVIEPLLVGDLLSVELQRDGRLVLTALASVVRTTLERNGGRIVGCNFIHELPEDQLTRLLG